MNRSRFVTPLVLTLVLVAGPVISTTASARPMDRGPDPLLRIEPQIEALDLTDETRTAVYAILDESAAEQGQFRRRVRNAHRELRSLLAQEQPDRVAVLAQVDVIGALRTESRKRDLQALLEIQTLLTPEQRASLQQVMRPPHGRRACAQH